MVAVVSRANAGRRRLGAGAVRHRNGVHSPDHDDISSDQAGGGPVRTTKHEGPCPSLMCLEPGPHEHPVCEVCGAVRYGNLMCERCNEVRRTNANPVVVGGQILEGALNTGGYR